MLSEHSLTEIAPPVGPRTHQANERAIALPYNRLTDLAAPQPNWHSRYLSWQIRERRQRQEQEAAAKLEADRCRLFGGEPGDDVSLCYKMLEFFGGLHYIDA